MTPVLLTAIEPTRWVLVFQRSSKVWWVRALAWGKYKHVAAYAYLPGFKAWLIYDVSMVRTAIIVTPDGDEALSWLAELTRDSDLVAIKRKDTPSRLRLFGWCVPAIAHLIGLHTRALRPDTLFRDCLRAGGELLAPAVRCAPQGEVELSPHERRGTVPDVQHDNPGCAQIRRAAA